MAKLDKTLARLTELHKYSIVNDDTYYSDKLLQIIIDLSTLDSNSFDDNTSDKIKDEIEKVKRKVPKWMKKTHQYNYQILKAYMDLSDCNEISISVDELEEYVDIGKVFLGHYNSMKTISEKNHAKIFDEINKQVELWEPVAKFITEEFVGNQKMTKQKATDAINNFYGDSRLNASNNGNVKFANIAANKDVYWINIHMDNRIYDEYHLVLNNGKKKEFTHLVIPLNIFNKENFIHRFDKTNGLDKFDIELDTHTLVDVKSGGTQFDFKQYIERTYAY